MKLNQVAVMFVTAVITLGATAGIGQAVTLSESGLDEQGRTLVNFSIVKSEPNPSARELCSVFPCPSIPGPVTAIAPYTATNVIDPRITDYAPFFVTGITYEITGDGINKYAWNPTVNRSDFFKKIEVLNNGTLISLSEGAVPPGEYINLIRTYSSQTGAPFNPSVTLQFSSEPVPEPSSVLGTLALGVLGAGLVFKRRFKVNGTKISAKTDGRPSTKRNSICPLS